MKITILGAGLIGSAMALDLAKQGHTVAVCDLSLSQAETVASRHEGISACQLDVQDKAAVKGLGTGTDLFVNAVPGHLGYRVLEDIVPFGKPIVDIAFYAHDPFTLDAAAKEAGIPLLVDCGVAPGMSNVLIGYTASQLEVVDSIEIYVGGLPVHRKKPLEYRTVFSPQDVIEEYLRPARMVEHGQLVEKEALSECELMEFDGPGTLEAFNTDGLRSLATTMNAPWMKEKTLRYPGHIEKIEFLKTLGFFGDTPLNGMSDSPRNVSSQLLFQEWEQYPDHRDLTVLRVIVDGRAQGKRLRYQYDMLDHYDETEQVSSMARTTGYTATALIDVIAKDMINKQGVLPPELISGDEAVFNSVMEYLAERGIQIQTRTQELN